MASAKHTGVCKLCGTHGPLCRSHVVPEFAYHPIKNGKNQIYAVGRKTSKVQTGYFERLLCSDCEQRLNGYETEFKKAWMDTIPSDFSSFDTRPFRDVISVDVPSYDRFKVFHLSVLWRAAVSGFKVDKGISLRKYETELASLILNGDPGQPGHFPFMAALSLNAKKQPVPTVAPLAHGKQRFEGHHFYMLSYAYCDWVFVIARPGPAWLTRIEKKCRAQNMFLLLTVPHEQSKSFGLWAKILRDLRE